jgi:hypothetical protein
LQTIRTLGQTHPKARDENKLNKTQSRCTGHKVNPTVYTCYEECKVNKVNDFSNDDEIRLHGTCTNISKNVNIVNIENVETKTTNSNESNHNIKHFCSLCSKKIMPVSCTENLICDTCFTKNVYYELPFADFAIENVFSKYVINSVNKDKDENDLVNNCVNP